MLLFLTVFALWTAVSTNATADHVRSSSDARTAFERARYAVGAEESLERKYRLEPGPDVRSRYDAAAQALEAALREAGRTGDAADRSSIARTLATHRRYLGAIARMFDAVDAGQTARVLAIDSDEVDPVFAEIERTVDGQAAAHDADAAAWLRKLDRRQSHVLIATPIAFAVGLLLLAAFVSILLTYRRRAETATAAELERLEAATLTDSLTGLRNHRAFHEDLVRETKRHEAPEIASLSLVTVSVDALKAVNEAHGHQAGDARLTTAAHCLRETAPDREAVYRVDGGKFAVILTDTHAWDAYRFAQRLQERLDREGPITVTVGIAEAEGVLVKYTLIRHADMALIEAKRTHRSALIYAPGIAAEPSERDDTHEHHLQTLATALARAVDAKDSHTRSHCETVSELCVRIGIELGLDEQRLAKLRLAGLLHDVGKIGIPDAILQKPGRLTDEEFETMKTHASLGHSIVSGTELDEEAHWILHHHERPDGHGYSDGLSDDAIPLESRVILVADAFEAITSDRVYRKGRPPSEAVTELERHAGTQFDPACVVALARAIHHDRGDPESASAWHSPALLGT